jgi:hypothetical protein
LFEYTPSILQIPAMFSLSMSFTLLGMVMQVKHFQLFELIRR